MENSLQEELLQVEAKIKANSLIGDKPVFDRSQFDWLPEFEAATEVIKQEFESFLRDRDVFDLPTLKQLSENESGHDTWRAIWLMACNEQSPRTISHFPKTFEAISKIPGVTSGFFSILSPGKHIPPHRGPYGGVIKCHLPIILPTKNEKCWLRVEDQVMNWHMGQATVFDDSYDHEVHNDTEDVRVVLLVEFKRPLPAELAQVNDQVISNFQQTELVQLPKRLYEDWEQKAFVK